MTLSMTFLFPCPHLADPGESHPAGGPSVGLGHHTVVFFSLKSVTLLIRAPKQSWGGVWTWFYFLSLFSPFCCCSLSHMGEWAASSTILELTPSQCLLVEIFKRICLVHLSLRLVPLGQVHLRLTSYTRVTRHKPMSRCWLARAPRLSLAGEEAMAGPQPMCSGMPRAQARRLAL